MNILISNDDGIKSEGLKAIVKQFSNKHNVLVVVPSENCSASSHAISIFKKMSVKKVDFVNNVTAYCVDGTSCDCIKFASLVLTDFNADIVISGINVGHNLGTDVYYSGTVSAAEEGSIFNKISFAVSSVGRKNIDFDAYAKITEKIIDILYPQSKKGQIWNINFPLCNVNDILGVVVTPLGKMEYSDNYQQLGENDYMLIGEPLDEINNPEDCDVSHSQKNYITVTPLITDRTDYKAIKELKNNKLIIK